MPTTEPRLSLQVAASPGLEYMLVVVSGPALATLYRDTGYSLDTELLGIRWTGPGPAGLSLNSLRLRNTEVTLITS